MTPHAEDESRPCGTPYAHTLEACPQCGGTESAMDYEIESMTGKDHATWSYEEWAAFRAGTPATGRKTQQRKQDPKPASE